MGKAARSKPCSGQAGVLYSCLSRPNGRGRAAAAAGPRDAHYPGEQRPAAGAAAAVSLLGFWFGAGLAGMDWILSIPGAVVSSYVRGGIQRLAMRRLSKCSCDLRLRQGIAAGLTSQLSVARSDVWAEYRLKTAHVLVPDNHHRGILPSAHQGCGKDPGCRCRFQAKDGSERGSSRFVAEWGRIAGASTNKRRTRSQRCGDAALCPRWLSLWAACSRGSSFRVAVPWGGQTIGLVMRRVVCSWQDPDTELGHAPWRALISPCWNDRACVGPEFGSIHA